VGKKRQAALEREIFRRFASVAGLPVLAGSVQSRCPPEPDILCEVDSAGLVAFELVDLVDQGLAHATAQANANPDSPRGVWFGDPTLERVRAKLAKTYLTGHPMELLAHGDDTLLPRDVWVPKFERRLRDIFDHAGSPFRRLWVANLGRLAATDPVWLVHPATDLE